jgi:hypothetical protein
MPGRDREPRLYRYILTSDDGMAPCIDEGLISLATCKPIVRRVARPGDWVLGFFGGGCEPGTLAWAARVERPLHHFDYQAAHPSRSDSVYAEGRDGRPVFLRPEYHPERSEKARDLSGPVLVFDPAAGWYFGAAAPVMPARLRHLAPSGQGHRVNFRRPGDRRDLLDWLAAFGPPGIYGRPRDLGGRDLGGCAPCSAPRPRSGC